MKSGLIKYFLLVLITLLSMQFVYSQNISDWTPYTSFQTIKDIAVDDTGIIYVSTLGGIFVYDNGTITSQYTTIDGLSRLDAEKIVFDNLNDRLIIGYIDGGIDLLYPSTGVIEFIGDIKRAENFSPRGINDLIINENELYVATDFGIVNYDLNLFVVSDSYTKLGDFERGMVVSDLEVVGDSLYAATASGIAYANINISLEFSDNWANFDSNNGFISEPILAISVFRNRIYASTNSGNYEYDGNSWALSSNFDSGVIVEYLSTATQLYALDNNQLFKIDDSGTLTEKSLGEEKGTSIQVNNSGSSDQILVGTLNEGVGIAGDDLVVVNFFSPEGPYQNTFDALKFVDDILIASSSNESDRNSDIDRGKGYYIYQENIWSSFNAQNNSILNSSAFYQAFTSTVNQDYYYFGSWGRGIARHDRVTNEIVVFDETNSTLRGWEADDPNFPVISGLSTDRNGDVWAVSRWAANPLYYKSQADDDWVSLPPAAGISSQDEHFGLFIDSFDQKWISIQATNLAGRGLIVMRTGDPTDPNDDEAVKLTDDRNNGFLPNLQVKAIIEDRNNEVWVGTERGIGRYIFPELIIDGGPDERRAQFLINEDTSAVSRVLLRDVNVSTMAVNSANQKWVGSENQGLYLINAEGSKIIKQFTTDNSPLFSNSIKSIAVKESTGEVFIATDKGLISYQDVPFQAEREMNELTIYPNPFRYDVHNEVFIEGLTDQTKIKVLGSDGSLVAEFDSFGGRTRWDVRGRGGSRIATGVYFVIALDENGNEKGIGKIAVIK